MKKNKIGILDIIIILAIIAAVVFSVNYFKTSSQTAGKIPTVTYQVEIKSVPLDYVDYYKNSIGETVKDSIKGGYMGNVVDVQATSNVEIRENIIDDEFVKSEFKDKSDVIITIEGKPTVFDDKDIKFATQAIKIGETVYLKSKNFVGYGYVTNININ